MNTQLASPFYQSLSRDELILQLIKLDILSLQNKSVDNLSSADIKLMWNLFIRHSYQEELLPFTPEETKHYLKVNNFRGFPVPQFIIVIAELRDEMFFDQAHQWGRFSGTSFENFLVDYTWFVKFTFFKQGTLAKETFKWMFSLIDDTHNFPQLPKLMLAMHEGSQYFRTKYNLSCSRQKLAYFVECCMDKISHDYQDCSNWLLTQINLPTTHVDMKLMWNLYIRQTFHRNDMLAFTSEEAQSYLQTDHLRGFSVPHYITVITELCGEDFLNEVHSHGEFANNLFEYFLIDYIWFIKRLLFSDYSLSKETIDWLISPTQKMENDDIHLPKLALSMYLGSSELRKEYNLSDLQQKKAYLMYFCKDHFPYLNCEYPEWLLDQLNLISSDNAKSIETQAPAYAMHGVNLLGWARTAVGIGEDVRVAAHALLSVGIPFSILDAALRMPPQPKQQNLGVDCYIAKAPRYQTDIVFLDAATQYRYYSYDLLKKSYLDRTIIGVCPWELPNWPNELAFALKNLTAFWAATRYIYNAFLPHFQENQIQLAPPAVVLPEEELDDFEITTVDGPLTFLTTFDGLSSIHRKNPFAVISAFNAAFPATCKDVRLIVKTMNFLPSHPDLQELAKMITQDSRIELINQALSREDLFALVRRSHCFVSLHRSEGFGRNIAEAMLFNRPVICSAYSGNLDFCFENNSFLVEGREIPVESGQYAFSNQQVWFDASVEHACARMREVYEKRATAAKKAAAARNYIRTFHSVEATGLRYRKLLQNFIQSKN